MTRSRRTSRRAFTLIEILVAILIIFLLMGLLVVAVRKAISFAKSNRDVAQVSALKLAVANFRTEFNFLPALVKDFDTNGPVRPVGSQNVPFVYSVSVPVDADVLRNKPVLSATNPDIRFSTYSIPYYLIGALEVSRDVAPPASNPPPIDGVAGLGFLNPKRDGTFEKSGRKHDPFFDVGKSSKSLFSSDVAKGRIAIRDANEVPVRYYRWLQGDPNNGNRIAKPDDANIPEILYRVPGDTSTVAPSEFLSAEFAILAAGPNGVFGDEADLLGANNPEVQKLGMSWSNLASKVGLPDPAGVPAAQAKVRLAAMKDNIVEVGK